MKHYNEQEVDKKIHDFLTKKLQKFPELAGKPAVEHPVAVLQVPVAAHTLILRMVR